MSFSSRNAATTALSPTVLAAALAAWTRGGSGDFTSAITTLPPRVGSAGWAARWAIDAAAALAAAAKAADDAAAALAAAAKAADDAAPVYGVIKEYGTGYWSRAYTWEVRRGAGQMTKAEAWEQRALLYKTDKRAQMWAEYLDAR